MIELVSAAVGKDIWSVTKNSTVSFIKDVCTGELEYQDHSLL